MKDKVYSVATTKREEMKMSISYIAGVVAGVLFAVLLWWLFARKAIKKGPVKYDERQLVARGRAYRTGFFTILGYCVVYSAVSAFGVVWCLDSVGMFIGCLVGVTAFAVSAIRNDAYFGLNEDRKALMRLGVVIIVVCLLSGVMNFVSGSLVEDGRLTGKVLSIVVAVMWAVIMTAQTIHSRRAGEQEDE